MKIQKILLLGISVISCIALIREDYYYRTEPRVLEVLPVSYYGRKVQIPADFPEPVRVVYNVPIQLQNVDISISPVEPGLIPELRKTYLRTSKTLDFDTLFPALVINNVRTLESGKSYTIEISYRYKSILRRLQEKPVIVLFTTTESSGQTKTGKKIDMQLQQSERGSKTDRD